MKRILIPIFLGVILTMTFYTIGIFFIGAALLLLPLGIVLFLIGLTGLVTLPLGLYRLLRKQTINKWLTRFIGLAIGFYVGLIFQRPIDDWDKKQRNISGKILTSEIEKFKEENGDYPTSLSQLNLKDLNESLPQTYQTSRFTYFAKNGEYDVDIPIPILDRWHWNKESEEFEYDDF
ncbi:sulfite exporter TauE/SafE family protein [Cryomorphaceae bacterium 1068]|nr:sulfite exporter TauE/SafE family protein [Cryomorphaceae bacterium 1068]